MRTGGIVFLLVSFGLISTISGQAGNGSSCAVSLKALPSEPVAQSKSASILLTSTVDATIEYLCSAGSSYDSTGIACYSLQCPVPVSYGPYGAQPYGAPGGSPPGYSGAPGRYSTSTPISVGQQVAYVETAHGCWKLKQVRLNTYVYLICFTKGYSSTLFQVVFKDNGLDLVNYDAIPYHQLTAVGRGSFTAENQFLCVAAVYSSYGPSYARGDHVYAHSSDQLAPVYIICPNNYKWYFCGNVFIKDTLDVSVWYAQNSLHAIFVAQRPQTHCLANGTLSPCDHTPLIQFTITPDIDHYICASRKETEITSIGPVANEGDPVAAYVLRGINTCTIVANNNATLLCCAVDVEKACSTNPPGTPAYSSFCIPYDTNSNRFLTERVVLLAGSDHAVDIQLTRSHGECCQFIMTNGPAQDLQLYSLQAIIGNLNNASNPDPAVVAPSDLGADNLFNSAVSCSTKAKCCGTSQTCITCSRPAKYAEKYLAELSCPSAVPLVSYGTGYDDGLYTASLQPAQQLRVPYAGPQVAPYGPRQANYSNNVVSYGGGHPHSPHHPHANHAYGGGGVPPAQPYLHAPPIQQQQPIYGAPRYN